MITRRLALAILRRTLGREVWLDGFEGAWYIEREKDAGARGGQTFPTLAALLVSVARRVGYLVIPAGGETDEHAGMAHRLFEEILREGGLEVEEVNGRRVAFAAAGGNEEAAVVVGSGVVADDKAAAAESPNDEGEPVLPGLEAALLRRGESGSEGPSAGNDQGEELTQAQEENACRDLKSFGR